MKDLKLQLIVQALDRATAPLRKVQEAFKGLEERAEHVEHAFKKISLGGILGGGVVLGVAAEAGEKLFELTKQTAELGESLLHTSQKTGMTVEQVQRLQFAAKQTGVDVDSLGQVFFMFQTHLANGLRGNKETLKALGELGIGMKELKRVSADPVAAFALLQDRFATVSNASERAKIAMDLFGRAGKQIIPLLAAGSEQTKVWGDQMERVGGIMDKEGAESSEAFIRQLNLMQVAMAGVQRRVGIQLLPVMERLVTRLAAVVEHLQPAVVGRFTEAMGKLVDQLPALVDLFSQFLEIVATAVPIVMDATTHLGGLKTILAGIGLLMAGEFLVNIVSLGKAIWGLVEATGALKVLGLVSGFQAMIGVFIALVPTVTSLADVFALLDLAMAANPVGLLVLAAAALAGLAYVIIRNWTPIAAFFSGVLKGIEDAFAKAWKAIDSITPAWLKKLMSGGAFALQLGGNPVALAGAAVGAINAPAGLLSRGGGGKSAPHQVQVDVKLHEGRVSKATVRSSNPATTATVTRGVMPG